MDILADSLSVGQDALISGLLEALGGTGGLKLRLRASTALRERNAYGRAAMHSKHSVDVMAVSYTHLTLPTKA